MPSRAPMTAPSSSGTSSPANSSRISIGHEGPVSAVAVSRDGRHALSGSRDRTLRLWDLATGQLVRTFEGHEHGVSSVAISPDGRHGLSGSYDRTVKLWDLADRPAPPHSRGPRGRGERGGDEPRRTHRPLRVLGSYPPALGPGARSRNSKVSPRATSHRIFEVFKKCSRC